MAFPYLVNWGYPERFNQTQSDDMRLITGIGASPGILEGIARVVRTVDEFDDVREGDILVCQMTNPAWVVLFTKIAGLVTDTGGLTSHPAVLSREFGIPAVIGTSVALPAHRDRRSHPDRRHGRTGGDPPRSAGRTEPQRPPGKAALPGAVRGPRQPAPPDYGSTSTGRTRSSTSSTT